MTFGGTMQHGKSVPANQYFQAIRTPILTILQNTYADKGFVNDGVLNADRAEKCRSRDEANRSARAAP